MLQWSLRATPEFSDEQYARWQSLLEERTGICFLQHKSILKKGLDLRMREINCGDYEQYFQQVRAIPEGVAEWASLVDRISVKETSFFRAPDSYTSVEAFLRQRLAQCEQQAVDRLDLWSVGCSTGEEAYSLAMLVSELIEQTQSQTFFGVVATDISKSAIQAAKQGQYSARKLEKLSPTLKSKYFNETHTATRLSPCYTVSPRIKNRVCFAQGNIIEFDRAPNMAMDVIFCQNVLVYFRRSRHKSVLDALVTHLKPGGMLVLGPGEVTGWRHPLMVAITDASVQAYIKAI